jgi:uncharacterized membrane protein (DUF485 family)
MIEQGKEAQLHAIAGQRWRVAWILSILMLIVYYGFILLVAFGRPFMGKVISKATVAGQTLPGLSWGILLGALVIVCAWILTTVYVWWANNRYDHHIAAIRGH